MKTQPIIYAAIFCSALAGSLLHFSGPIGKIMDRVDPQMAMLVKKPDPSGKPNTTTLFKTSYPMPSEISEGLARAWIDRARKERFEGGDPEIADIVANQQIEPCTAPGRMRMEDGQCWLPDLWKKLHP